MRIDIEAKSVGMIMMRKLILVHLPAVCLALIALTLNVRDTFAQPGANFGAAVDAFCSQFNGTTPFADQSCALCHDNADFALRIEPQWTWWEDGNATGDFSPFCGTAPGPQNTPPVAQNDNASTNAGTPVTVDVLANDTDADGDLLSVSTVTPGNNGAVTNNGIDVSYTPNAGFAGSDSFTYTASDGSGGTDLATVTVTVNGGGGSPANNAPQITSVAPTTATTGVRYSYNVQAVDPDAGDVLTFSLDVQPQGMTIDSATGLIDWTPSAGQTGTQNVTVRVTDASGLSDTQTFTVTVGEIATPTTCLDNDSDLFSPEGGVCGPIDCDDLDPAINPAAAESCDDGIDNDCDGAIDGQDSECNGADCISQLGGDGGGDSNAQVTVEEAEWEAEDAELKVKGRGAPGGASVSVSDADTGLVLVTSTVDAEDDEGEWEVEVRDLAAAPCRVRAEINGQFSERDVENAPRACNSGSRDSERRDSEERRRRQRR